MFHRIKQTYREKRVSLIRKNFLLEPKLFNSVQFGLEMYTEKAHIFDQPSYPDKESLGNGTWHCIPYPPPKPMPSSAFIHYLLHDHAPHDGRFQRRLQSQSRWANPYFSHSHRHRQRDDAIVFGWGVHIFGRTGLAQNHLDTHDRFSRVLRSVDCLCCDEWRLSDSDFNGVGAVSSLTLVWIMMAISRGMGSKMS